MNECHDEYAWSSHQSTQKTLFKFPYFIPSRQSKHWPPDPTIQKHFPREGYPRNQKRAKRNNPVAKGGKKEEEILEPQPSSPGSWMRRWKTQGPRSRSSGTAAAVGPTRCWALPPPAPRCRCATTRHSVPMTISSSSRLPTTSSLTFYKAGKPYSQPSAILCVPPIDQ